MTRNKLYLTNYMHANYFQTEDQQGRRIHMENIKKPAITNVFFRSKNLEFGNAYSRRDDLTSIIYLIVSMINKFRPIVRCLSRVYPQDHYSRFKMNSTA